jgi:hypothetical protein
VKSDQLELIGQKDRLDELWPQIEPLFARCCEEAADGELDAQDIYNITLASRCQIAVWTLDSKVEIAMAWEYIHYPKFTAVNIFALGGEHGLSFKSKFWPGMLSIFKQQNVTSVDAWVSPQMSHVLNKRFGFNHVYNHMRLRIQGDQHAQ